MDILQVGARNMKNLNLLAALGQIREADPARARSATIQEWLLAAESIMSGDNYEIILCERCTFEVGTDARRDPGKTVLTAAELTKLRT